MPRRSTHSNGLVAAVRRHFGLEQQELALFLGVSRELLANIEAGRRTISHAVYQRLLPLARLLPETPAPLAPLTAPAELPAGLPAPAADPLEARRDYCAHKAAQLRRELRPFSQRAAAAARWQQALPQLLAELPLSTAIPADDPAQPRQWLLRRAAAFSADDVARHHLLRLQAEALEAEAAALAALLAAPAQP